MDLSSLRPAKGAVKNKKRRGRGEGSGLGVTAGRGHKGYRSRGGSKRRVWFEGGQMPLQRRLPKFGFTNIRKIYYQVVNIGDLQKITDVENFTKDILAEKRIIRKRNHPVKILGNGILERKISVEAEAVSNSAKEMIEKLGGSVNLI